MKLSLCLIVKNEEENLRKSLKYVDIFTDELVVVDTGSTDSTKKVAENFGANVYDFEWTDSFSEARNFSYSKAKHSWIMWMDADDIIDRRNAKKIAKIKKRLKQGIDGVWFRRNLAYSSDGVPILYHLFLYITPRDKYYWKYRAYNSLTPHKQKSTYNFLKYHDIEINHWFDTDRKAERKTQTLKLLQKEEDKTPYIWFALGEEYRSVEKYRKSVKAFEKYLKLAAADKEDEHQVFLAHFNIAKALFLWGKREKLIKKLNKLVQMYPKYAEGWVMLGDTEFQKQNWKSAIEFYEKAVECPYPKISQVAFERRLYTYYPLDMIGVAYYKLGDVHMAYKYKKKALGKTDRNDKSIARALRRNLSNLRKQL